MTEYKCINNCCVIKHTPYTHIKKTYTNRHRKKAGAFIYDPNEKKVLLPYLQEFFRKHHHHLDIYILNIKLPYSLDKPPTSAHYDRLLLQGDRGINPKLDPKKVSKYVRERITEALAESDKTRYQLF